MENRVETKNSEGELLVGLETLPGQEASSYPTVLLVHGFGVTKSEYGMWDELAAKLAENGFLVYRFDFSGRGESEGDYVNTSLSKQKDDLECMLNFIRERPLVNTSRIGVHGQSFGTAVTVATCPDVASIILMGSIAEPMIISGNAVKWQTLDKTGISRKTKPNGDTIEIGPQFWTDLEKYDLLSQIKQFTCPILFIHGSEDDRVPMEQMEQYFSHAKNPRKIVIDGASHGMEPCRPEMYEHVVAWFTETLQKDL